MLHASFYEAHIQVVPQVVSVAHSGVTCRLDMCFVLCHVYVFRLAFDVSQCLPLSRFPSMNTRPLGRQHP